MMRAIVRGMALAVGVLAGFAACSSTPNATWATIPAATDDGGVGAATDAPNGTSVRDASTHDTGVAVSGRGGVDSGVATVPTGTDAGSPVSSDGASWVPTTSTCVTGSYYLGFGDGSRTMDPGQACVGCHASSSEAPLFSVAGTVYYNPNEADNCNGFNGVPPGSGVGSAMVQITDATGTVYGLPVNAAGNFYARPGLSFPLRHARVVGPTGATRDMIEAPPNGECNGCHTAMGTSTVMGFPPAPGRVLVP